MRSTFSPSSRHERTSRWLRPRTVRLPRRPRRRQLRHATKSCSATPDPRLGRPRRSRQVIAGDWLSPADGVTQADPAEIQIIHVVALKEAHDSGAWTPGLDRLSRLRQRHRRRAQPARPITTTVNNDNKGDKDPSNWLRPGRPAGTSPTWSAIKARWGLSMDQSEAGRIRNPHHRRLPRPPHRPLAQLHPTRRPPPHRPRSSRPSLQADRSRPSYPTVCIHRHRRISTAATSPTAASRFSPDPARRRQQERLRLRVRLNPRRVCGA